MGWPTGSADGCDGAIRYASCMSTQIAVRIPEQLAAALDDGVRRGYADNRAEAVRRALEMWLDQASRAAIGREIDESYRRTPQDDDLVAAATAAAISLIAEEPW